MGLSITYSGRLRRAELLQAIIEEVKDVAEVYGWKYQTYNSRFPNDRFEDDDRTSFDNIYGICFTPTECETVPLTFLSGGRMVQPARVLFFAHDEDAERRAYIYSISVKTQYAGVVVHQLIIRLFKYLSEKYLDDFRLQDESHYWETGDETLMRKQFDIYDKLLDNVVLGIQTFPVKQGEDMSAYFERLMKHINDLKK
jgi:hypothetical protein